MAKSGFVSGMREDDEWRVEEDLRTLCRAKEIEADPVRFERCRKLARKKQQEMKGVADSPAKPVKAESEKR